MKLFIRDNISGEFHEYGTDRHDSLRLNKNGTLQYYNLQCGEGSRIYPGMPTQPAFSFCDENGRLFRGDGGIHGEEYVDLGGYGCVCDDGDEITPDSTKTNRTDDYER